MFTILKFRRLTRERYLRLMPQYRQGKYHNTDVYEYLCRVAENGKDDFKLLRKNPKYLAAQLLPNFTDKYWSPNVVRILP